MPTRQIDICRRLRDFRLSTGLPRATLATILNIETGNLANCEHQRAPVRLGLVRPLFEMLGVNPIWLATGKSYVISNSFVDWPKVLDGLENKTLFSHAYDEHIRSRLVSEHSTEVELLYDQETLQDTIKALRRFQDFETAVKLLPRHRLNKMLAFLDEHAGKLRMMLTSQPLVEKLHRIKNKTTDN